MSCQASEFSPLNRPSLIAALALVAEQQGAVGVRIDGASNIRAVRKATALPIIGIEKRRLPGCSVYITPTLAAVRRVVQAGANIVALDCTNRRRPQGEQLGEIVERAKFELKIPLMADVATLEDGIAAADLGVDIISTTLYGYTESTRNHRGPAFRLLQILPGDPSCRPSWKDGFTGPRSCVGPSILEPTQSWWVRPSPIPNG